MTCINEVLVGLFVTDAPVLTIDVTFYLSDEDIPLPIKEHISRGDMHLCFYHHHEQ
jgi:hypothetical protein